MLERVWGSRKFASFVVVVFWVDVLVVPVLCVMLKIGSWGVYNYVPSGLVGVVFAGLSAWREEIPRLYRYKIVTGSVGGRREREKGDGVAGQDPPGVILSDKSTAYLLAAQLALSQFPYQLMPAVVGWLVGSAWMGDLLPGRLGRWRVPLWMLGESAKSRERGQFEGLRRRLEEEGSAADGMRNVSDQRAARGDEDERRGFVRQITSYFTGS